MACFETSLKIFKHYKLKPSFPIMIKDNKTKDRAGVGDKPPPPSFVRSINPKFIQKLIRTEMDQFRFDPIWSILIQLDLIWTDHLWFSLIWFNLVQLIWFVLLWSNLNQLDLIWSSLNQFYLIWTNLN